MNKRTFAIATAVITFTVGVAIARLTLPNLFETPEPPPPISTNYQHNKYVYSGPYQYKNLSLYLIHAPDEINHRLYTPLQQAMERQIVIVHETENVNELAIENVSATEEVLVQAGDIVKGGKQDRVLSVDVILPAKSGRLPISAFCVENSRWYRRGAESADHFTITGTSAGFSLKRAIKDVGTQIGVWDEVKSSQDSIAGVAGDVRSHVSPTSLPLALENQAVQKSTAPYVESLEPIARRWGNVIGVAFSVNNELTAADVYSSNEMFLRLWPRLLKAAAVDAIAAASMETTGEHVPIENVAAFLEGNEAGVETVSYVTERTLSVKREIENGLFFETRDMDLGGAWVHRNYLTKGK